MSIRHANRRQWLLGLISLWLLGGCVFAGEKSAGVNEYQVKAAFLYNFTQFVEWPTNSLPPTNTPIVIVIVGADPFGNILDETVRGEVVQGRPLVVKRLRPDEDFRGCHVLFISRSEKDRLPEVLDKVKDSPVLTVGDTAGFAEQGGMVNLALVNNTVKLEINQAKAEQGGLKLSSKLLKLARIVKSK